MSIFSRNSLLVVLWVNVAASLYYLMFEMVPISTYWHSLKAGWLMLPLFALGIAFGYSTLARIHRRSNKTITAAVLIPTIICLGAGLYFSVLANIALFRILIQHTTITQLALGIAWASAACALAWFVPVYSVSRKVSRHGLDCEGPF